jgi:hypothetical protein
MKEHSLTLGAAFLLMLVCIACIGCKKSSPEYTEITENDVLAIMNEVEKATLAKDVDGVIRHLAPFVVINVILPPNDSTFLPQRAQMSRDQYATELKTVFANLTYHEYRRENDTIIISNDKRSARTETDVIEVITMYGKQIRTTTHEISVLEIIDGKILVTSIDAVITKKES